MEDWTQDPQAKAWVDRVRNELVPMIDDSAFVTSIVPEAEKVDVKFAVELGLSIMLDKPIIAVVQPGVKVPEKLVLVADYIVEADMFSEDGHRELAERLKRIMDEHHE